MQSLVHAQHACGIRAHEFAEPCKRDVSGTHQRRVADAERGLQAHHARSAGGFVVGRVGCVVGGDGIDPPLFHGMNEEVDILLRPQGRVHAEARFARSVPGGVGVTSQVTA